MKTKTTLLKKDNKFLLLFALALLTSAMTYSQQILNETLQHDGKTREYRLYIPASYDSSTPTPLILNFHGYTNNINIQYNQSAFQNLAETNQFIFVTPQGLGNSAGWAIDNVFGGNQDDLGFASALMDLIESQYNIDIKRIYSTGFSNGGFFSYRLACELNGRIAAIASIAGSMTSSWLSPTSDCQPEHPTPILQITGTNDPTITVDGNSLGAAIVDVMEYWSSYNNGDTTPQVINLGSGSTHSIWGNGDNGVTVEFIEVGSKQHSWIGGNVDTSNEIWDFFSRFDIDGEILTLSNDEFELDTVSIFPNPTASFVTLKNNKFNKNSDYKIISIQGQLLTEGKVTSSKQKIDLSNLASGLYILNIEDTAYKIVKTN